MRRLKIYVEDQVRFDTAAGTWQRSSQRMRVLVEPNATNVDQIYIGATETQYTYHSAFDDTHLLYVNPAIKRQARVPVAAIERLAAKLQRRHAMSGAIEVDAAPQGHE